MFNRYQTPAAWALQKLRQLLKQGNNRKINVPPLSCVGMIIAQGFLPFPLFTHYNRTI